jgi:hypothetical protein
MGTLPTRGHNKKIQRSATQQPEVNTNSRRQREPLLQIGPLLLKYVSVIQQLVHCDDGAGFLLFFKHAVALRYYHHYKLPTGLAIFTSY